MRALQITILTEDSGKQGAPVIEALVKAILQRLAPGLDSRRLVAHRPAGLVAQAMRGHRWKSTRGTPDLRRELLRDLGRRLRQGDWVVLHHDGDCAWCGGGAPSHDDQVAALRAELERALGADAPACLPRLLLLRPFYSVEAWLYLNRDQVDALVRAGEAPAAAQAWLDGALREGALDHVEKPKDACPLGDAHNATLTTQLKRAPLERSPSFRATQGAWAAAPTLADALKG
ncbi:MAG: hypothetical protein JNM72_16310 [Deltaproteobacteria bacterium]|nr:hypothetical protein [Deltaproteobacteria bacterium]